MYDEPSASRTSTNWHTVLPVVYPFLNTALFAAQLYSLYVIHVIATRHEARTRAGRLPRASSDASSGSDTTSGDDVTVGEKDTWRPESTTNEEKKGPAFERSPNAPAAARFVRNASVVRAYTACALGEHHDPGAPDRPSHRDCVRAPARA